MARNVDSAVEKAGQSFLESNLQDKPKVVQTAMTNMYVAIWPDIKQELTETVVLSLGEKLDTATALAR